MVVESIDTQETTGMCPHGNFPKNCQICKEGYNSASLADQSEKETWSRDMVGYSMRVSIRESIVELWHNLEKLDDAELPTCLVFCDSGARHYTYAIKPVFDKLYTLRKLKPPLYRFFHLEMPIEMLIFLHLVI